MIVRNRWIEVTNSLTAFARELKCAALTVLKTMQTLTAIYTPERAAARGATLPWFCYAVVAGATSIVFGILWDISWHRTIGRDTFWTPAHLAIYLGGLVVILVFLRIDRESRKP